MHRIDTNGATVANRFKQSPAPATQVGADWLNDVQENLVGFLDAFGIAPVKGQWGQMAAAVAGVGLTGRKAITDLDALAKTGFFGSSPIATGRPDGEDAGLVLSIFDTADSADGCQLFVAASADSVWLRRWDGEAWTDWVRVVTSAAGGGGVADAYGTAAGQGGNGACAAGSAVKNLSAVSRTASGSYSVAFETPLPVADYVLQISCTGQNIAHNITAQSQFGFSVAFQSGQANTGDSPQNPTRFGWTCHC
ncbi:MAG: hypothetical protein GC145_14320 [Caulobacter sp.]|nr:hypothetical protein [Caulobacter sp.]